MAAGTSAVFYYTDFIRRTMSEKKQRDSKYNVSKRTDNRMCDGIVFDSALEMRFYRDAVLPGILSGEITYCERQKEYLLQEGFEHQDKNIFLLNMWQILYLHIKTDMKMSLT